MTAAPASGGRAGLGWAVLVAALAVPGFLFYHWWSSLKAERDRGVATKAKSRLPEGGVFQSSPAAGRLSNPISASTVAAAAPAQPAPAAPPQTQAASPAGTAPAGAAAAAGEAAAVVVLSRDPMLSQMDIVRLREEEEEKERIRREIEAAARRPKPRPPGEVPIEERIELQGIIVMPAGGARAIVNGATLDVGDSFQVAGYKMKVRVVRIAVSEVTFEYKNRKFRMKVSSD